MTLLADLSGNVSCASLDAAVDLQSVAVHEIGHLLGLSLWVSLYMYG